MTCAIVLAAGAGRRFGAEGKQLAQFRGRPLLQWAVDAACASSLDSVVVVLGARADAVREAVSFGRASVVEAHDWEEGMAASLRCGVREAAARGCPWVVVVLGDAPRIVPGAIDAVAEGALGAPAGVEAVRLRVGGRPAHPVALRQTLFSSVQRLTGDAGARALLTGLAVLEVDGDAFGDAGDVDTVEALRALE